MRGSARPYSLEVRRVLVDDALDLERGRDWTVNARDLRRCPAGSATGCDDLPVVARLLERRPLAGLRLDGQLVDLVCSTVKTLSFFVCVARARASIRRSRDTRRARVAMTSSTRNDRTPRIYRLRHQVWTPASEDQAGNDQHREPEDQPVLAGGQRDAAILGFARPDGDQVLLLRQPVDDVQEHVAVAADAERRRWRRSPSRRRRRARVSGLFGVSASGPSAGAAASRRSTGAETATASETGPACRPCRVRARPRPASSASSGRVSAQLLRPL